MSKRKQISIAFMLIFILVLVCGCQDSNTVSKTEYDKVVEERDYYKELYENSVNGESTTELNIPLWRSHLIRQNRATCSEV